MRVKNIRFIHDWENNSSIEDHEIDVLVELENGYNYVLTATTIKHIQSVMEKNEMRYYPSGYPVIIVKELTENIINETMVAFAEKDDGYWLELYHFAEDIKETMFYELDAELLTEQLSDEE